MTASWRATRVPAAPPREPESRAPTSPPPNRSGLCTMPSPSTYDRRYSWPDFRRPWADAGLLTDVAAGRPPHALARHVGTRPPHVACAHVGVSQPAGEKRPSARTPAGPGPRRSVAARPIAQARTRSRLICERRACAYQLRKPGLGAFVGLRTAEVVGLRVADVDFMRGIVRPVQQRDGEPLKSETSRTPLPIPSE